MSVRPTPHNVLTTLAVKIQRETTHVPVMMGMKETEGSNVTVSIAFLGLVGPLDSLLLISAVDSFSEELTQW